LKRLFTRLQLRHVRRGKDPDGPDALALPPILVGVVNHRQFVSGSEINNQGSMSPTFYEQCLHCFFCPVA